MNCDLCGKEAEMFKAVIEGSRVTVCEGCSEYGVNVEKVQPVEKKIVQPRYSQSEVIEGVISSFGDVIRRKREQLGLSHKEFAQKIAEKESTLHKLEIGTLVPTLERARKLEKMLRLTLVEEQQDEQVVQRETKTDMTLGDMVKIKKRKSK